MLESFFQPASVAVIGASAEPAKLGHAVLKNLVGGCPTVVSRDGSREVVIAIAGFIR
jgi:acyl-CoA synthetase (NDP forming)